MVCLSMAAMLRLSLEGDASLSLGFLDRPCAIVPASEVFISATRRGCLLSYMAFTLEG